MSGTDISPFSAFLADRYPALKASRPSDGRRKLKHMLANDFWKLDQESRDIYAKASADPEKKVTLLSALEIINDDHDEHDYTLGMGIIVRTEYTDDEAWNTFVTAVKDAEKDLLSQEEPAAGPSAVGSTYAGDDSESESDGDGDEGNGNEHPTTELFTLINPQQPLMREHLSGISNLRALRLFNDIDIISAPVRPQDTQRIKPGNRIMDLNGSLEAYTGDLVWIYDSQSNRDKSVRLVNQKCETYGSATADSWRPRASFLPELQINLVSGAMKIDFGGLDRWDYSERQRNLADVESFL